MNDAELKQNLLARIEELEGPVLESNPFALKDKASKTIQRLFGISISFSEKVLEKEYLIHERNSKITANYYLHIVELYSWETTEVLSF